MMNIKTQVIAEYLGCSCQSVGYLVKKGLLKPRVAGRRGVPREFEIGSVVDYVVGSATSGALAGADAVRDRLLAIAAEAEKKRVDRLAASRYGAKWGKDRSMLAFGIAKDAKAEFLRLCKKVSVSPPEALRGFVDDVLAQEAENAADSN